MSAGSYYDQAEQAAENYEGEPVACVYFALCDRSADGVVPIGFLDPIPTCQRCADKVGADLTRGTFDVASDGLSATFTPEVQ